MYETLKTAKMAINVVKTVVVAYYTISFVRAVYNTCTEPKNNSKKNKRDRKDEIVIEFCD